jgi:hypothetical protein
MQSLMEIIVILWNDASGWITSWQWYICIVLIHVILLDSEGDRTSSKGWQSKCYSGPCTNIFISDIQDRMEHVVSSCPYILLRGTIHGEWCNEFAE